jgi:DNA-binding Xre family transcriptional regulator
MGQEAIDETEWILGGLPQMIADCKARKIDLILTKSLSSIKRNTKDSLKLIYDLSTMNPPVGVYFEDNNFYSLQDKTRIFLPLLIETAAWESEYKGKRIGCISFTLNYKDILKDARTRKGMTQQEVAETASIAMRHYQMFETGRRDLTNASFRVVLAICRTLDIEPTDLIRELPISKRNATRSKKKCYTCLEE